MACWRVTLGLTLTWLAVVSTVTGLWLPHLNSENSEHVQLQITEHDAVDRQRRSTRSLPAGVDVTTFVEGRNVVLTLQRIADSGVNLPVHTLRNGTVVHVDLNSDQEYSYYEDEKREALILLQRNQLGTPNNSYTLFGTFMSDLDRYLIQQGINKIAEDGENIVHAVTKLPDKMVLYNDDVIYPETLIYKKHTEKRAARSKRQTHEYYIELYMVIDYSLYSFWRNRATGTSSQKDADAKQNIRKFYSYVLYGIDQRYRGITDQTYTVRVVSPGLLILDTPQDAPMTEQNKVLSSSRDILSSSTVLNAFSDWVNGQSGLPQRDHTMLFTNYDIVSGGSSGGDSAGIAFVGSLCTYQAQSVIEDEVSPFTMTTAAHELGHSLGADHDGTGNTCSSSSNYIMASVNSVAAASELMPNMWIFSSCSITDFTSYINKLNRDNENCMTDTSSGSTLPSINQPMADVFPADEICALTEGEGSFVCRSIQDFSTLCATMFCNAPGTSQCYSVMPPEGTSCGSGKICQKGRCVSSANAPQVPDNCPLGDQPGILSDYSQTCSEYVASNSHRCYPEISSWTGETCCESCAAIYTGIQGCEYGDQASWCKTLDRYQCYVNADTCCGYCNSPGMKDTTRPGCEYGDHFSNCDKNLCQLYNTASKEGCCETCGTPVKTTTTTTSTTTTTTPKTSTTTSSTTTTTSKTTSTSTTSKTTPSTTKSTSKTTPSTEKTSRTITLTGPSSTGTTVIPTVTEAPSDSVIIGIGVGVGVVVVIVATVIVIFICYKRRHRYIRKQSKSSNNAYDNIGFVKPSSRDDVPHHPPPRRDNSVTSSVRPPPLPGTLDRGPLRPPNLNLQSFGTTGNTDSNEIDGYMTPNGVKVKTISNGVHYTAPDKPKFNFNVLNGGERTTRNSSTNASDNPRTPRKPKHYRRSAASNSSNEVDNSNKESPINTPRGNEISFAEKRTPVETNYDNKGLEGDTYNEISEVINKFNLGARDNEKRDVSETKPNGVHKPIPKLPPKPKPRPHTNETGLSMDGDQESQFRTPLKPVNHKLRSHAKDTNAQAGSELESHFRLPRKPVNNKFTEKDISAETLIDSRPTVPLKPTVKNDEMKSKLDKLLSVESRVGGLSGPARDHMGEKSYDDNDDRDNNVANKSKALKPPTRPPLRPVPRRKKSEGKNAQDNPSFDEDTVINI